MSWKFTEKKTISLNIPHYLSVVSHWWPHERWCNKKCHLTVEIGTPFFFLKEYHNVTVFEKKYYWVSSGYWFLIVILLNKWVCLKKGHWICVLALYHCIFSISGRSFCWSQIKVGVDVGFIMGVITALTVWNLGVYTNIFCMIKCIPDTALE